MIHFNLSKAFTLGIELEIQIINRDDNDLTGLADDVLQQFKNESYDKNIKPEITQDMLEINSSIHDNIASLRDNLLYLKDQLILQTDKLNIFFAGGGTHPFQMWNERKLYPKESYRIAEQKYGYLTKMFTVFGMHIHIGCTSGDNALYLTQALSRYIPHLIALSASSPFCQGIDTQFHSSRSNIVNLFPLSGTAPFILDWQEFCDYLVKMQKLPWVDNINNFYWDIRPRAEYGTIEIRVCDTPLTIEKAVTIAAFAQSLAHYLLEEKPHQLCPDKYGLYKYNRFQASKNGFAASLIDPKTFNEYSLREDLLAICQKIEPHAKALGNAEFLATLILDIQKDQNDAAWLKKLFAEGESLKNIVMLAGHLWAGKIKTS